MPIIGKIVQGIGAGIGLAAEAVADHKEKKKAALQSRSVSPHPAALSASEDPRDEKKARRVRDENFDDSVSSNSDSDDGDDDDDNNLNTDRAEWALDEAAQELEIPPPSYEEAASTSTPMSAEEVATSFLRNHKISQNAPSHRPLPYPVVLPQRRPKDKSRGFVRAYAPLLGDCAGIDQKTFIDFLDDFDQASRASSVFDVINIACFAVGMVPNPIAMGVSIAVQVASRTGQELQSRYRRNTYLDQINETMFKPRGLYCMIMTFKPDSPYDPVLGVDVRSSDMALAKSLSIPESEWKQKLKNIRLTSGVSRGEVSLPESAPLIYPALDAAAVAATKGEGELPEKKQNALKSSASFVSAYLDRRAQASYAGMHPDSQLASPPPAKPFASRFSDPNHPANSGSIVALLTGGHFDPKSRKRVRRAQCRAARRGYQLSEHDLQNAAVGRAPGRRQGPISRIMTQDVLYLTIVNLPSESEMRELMQELERSKNQQSGSLSPSRSRS